jgi:hypothetical protein
LNGHCNGLNSHINGTAGHINGPRPVEMAVQMAIVPDSWTIWPCSWPLGSRMAVLALLVALTVQSVLFTNNTGSILHKSMGRAKRGGIWGA